MNLFKKHILKEQLGQVLIQRGVISPEQLDKALKVQKEQGGLLGEVLTQLGFASEEDIVQALAIQHDFPYLPLENYDIDEEALRLVPEEFVRKNHVLPVDKMGDILTVVMANPLDHKTVEAIESFSKCKVQIFVATYTEIKEAIKHCYSKEQAS